MSSSRRPARTGLEDWEDWLAPRVRQVELLGEITISDQERAQLGKVIGLRVRSLGHGRAVRVLRSKHPFALAVYLVAEGVYGYEGGDYWSEVVEVTGFSRSYVSRVGRAFENIVEEMGLPLFYDMRVEAHRYVSLILAHGGIPNYCLPDFFAKMLQPSVIRAQYADMSAAELIDEWRWRSSLRYFVDKPVIRFLIYGGRVAEDFVERCREMAWTYLDTGVVPGPEEVGLPRRVVVAYDEWIAKQGAEQVRRDTGDRWRLRKPQLLVDPWGEGVLVDLPAQQVPATEIYADITWQIVTDHRTEQLPVHVGRVGFDRKSETEALPLTQPTKSVEVSLLVDGDSKRTWRYPGIDEEKPLLVFDPERDTLVPWTLSLPARHLHLLYPADLQLHIEGDGRLVEELPRMPWGWSAFRGETWDLTKATRLVLLREGEEILAAPLRPDETAQRPSLQGGKRFLTEESDDRAPVYIGDPPCVRVPLTGRRLLGEEVARWRLGVRNTWAAEPQVNATATLAELEDVLEVSEKHVDVPLSLPSLLDEAPYGNFAVRLRGPLGRDAAFTLRMIPHFVLCGHEELHLPAAKEGAQPVTLLAETLPEDRVECQGEDAECRVRLSERGKKAWQHEVEVGPNATEVALTLVHPTSLGEPVRVPIRVPVHRLRWALVDEEMATHRNAWTGSVIKRPIEAVQQLRSPFLLIKLPTKEGSVRRLGLRLLNFEGRERQVTDQLLLADRRATGRFDLGAFLDTIRASRSPVLRFELAIWGLPERDVPLRLPVLSLTKTLLVENVQLTLQVVDDDVSFDLAWSEPVPLRNRCVRFWPLWRPWDPVFEQPIPDEAEGELSFPVSPSKLKSGKYRLEFLVVDPWTGGDTNPECPPAGSPSTADVELISPDRQLEILDHRLRQQGPGFETRLERATIYQDIGAVGKSRADRQWCYRHLDDGGVPERLALVDLAREAGDDALTRSLQLKLFAARRLRKVLAMRAAGELSLDHFEDYLHNLPRSGLLPVESCHQLLEVEDETVRLHAAQQLIRRGDTKGPGAVVRWVEDAKLSDADAVALLTLNAEFSAEVLKRRLGNPIATRLLRALAPELGEKTPIVQPGTWVYTDAGWGRIESIEDQKGAPVQQFLSGQMGYRLRVTLRPAVDAEQILIDLKKRMIIFTDADTVYTCGKCNGFSAQDPHLIADHHDPVAHSGRGAHIREEKLVKRSLRNLTYSPLPPLKRGLDIPESFGVDTQC